MISRWLGLLLIAPIRFYKRFVSPMRPPSCRFYPSCSSYAVKAIEVHGPFVGSYLAIKRLFRCHPWTPGGVDMVPPKGRWREVRAPYDPTPSDESDAADGDAGGGDDTAAATRSALPFEQGSSLSPLANPGPTRPMPPNPVPATPAPSIDVTTNPVIQGA